MYQKMFQVDAFSDHLFGGNPAAVLVLEEWLSDDLMQAIAAENNLAETAFLIQAENGWNLRWFTPTVEVDFCGHATLAAAHILVTEYGKTGPLTFSARVGQLSVEVIEKGYLLDLPCVPPETLSQLPSNIESLFTGRVQSYFKNFENIFVELPDENSVRSYIPNLTVLEELGPVGLVITAKGDEYDFVSRYFAPGAGIPEDPVTGSIHATLVPFWSARLDKSRLSAYQASRRGGHLICELKNNRVSIEGKAVTFMKAEINLPC